MKLPQSDMESANTAVWIDEMWSILQCCVLLLLGYVVTRAWLWYRNSLLIKAKLQHINFEEDDSVMPNDNQEVEHSPSDSPSRAKSSKLANAQMRKRLRKRRGSELSNDPDKVAVEVQGKDTSAQQSPEAERKVEEVSSSGVATEVCAMEAVPNVSCTLHESPSLAGNEDQTVGDTKEADNDEPHTDMQQDVQTPILTAVSCTSYEIQPADAEKHVDCYANASGNDEPDTDMQKEVRTPSPTQVPCTLQGIPPADDEKYVDRDTSEADNVEPDMDMQHDTQTHEIPLADDEEHVDREADNDEPDADIQQDIPEPTLGNVSCTLHESPPADDETHESGINKPDMDMHQDTQQQLLFQFEVPAEHWVGEHLASQDLMLPCQESPNYFGEAGSSFGIPCNIDWDRIESDSDDESDIGTQTVGSQRRDSAPILYCSAPQTPVNNVMGSGFASCVDGWVAVAVPTECAPPGTLDGRWMNREGEKILIERLDIFFESGVTWTMTMHSPTQISVDVEGVEFTAELDQEAEHLIWSDGDVWDFHGRVDLEDQPRQIAEGSQIQWPDQHCSEPTMQPEIVLQQSWDCQAFGEHFTPMEPMQDTMNCLMWDTIEQPALPSINQMLPTDAKEWEMCWDWKKKGFCPRGVACDWYHPAPSTRSPCQPCDASFY